ncbi:MAG: hypothetical protein V3V99_03290 [candidate division Zixibacteria bacterium]
MRKRRYISIYLISFFFVVCMSAKLLGDAPRQPTSQELLAGMGYDATNEGLGKALDSSDPWAQIYSLMILQENNDPTYLEVAISLLGSTSVKVQLEAAKLLSQFDRIKGIRWLEKWEDFETDWSSPFTDTAHAVLDAASALAARGDERLHMHIRPLLQHKFWSVRMHAARALGDFGNTDDPELEATWIISVDVALEALKGGTDREDFVELYLTWLVSSLFRQANITPGMTEKFAELAAYDHPVVCNTIGKKISEYDANSDEN